MASFLITRKMSPELAARLAASIRGRRAEHGARLAPRALGVLRLSALLAILAATCWFILGQRRADRELEDARSSLLARARAEAAALTRKEQDLVTRVRLWLQPAAGGYPGDLVASELRAVGAFAALLTRPAVYVRGNLASFGGDRGIAESAASSARDAFVLCLVEPPAARSEKALLKSVRAAYRGGREADGTRHFQRLHDAVVGLPFLTGSFRERVLRADARELEKLRRAFERAPLKAARLAAKASVLVFAMDEPGEAGPAELDGERPHHVRVGIVDLASDELVLLLRRRVDPSWLSPTTRAEYAQGVDACALALDVHASVSAPSGGD